MTEDKFTQLVRLFIDTVNNHHQYQEESLGGEYNLQWADWYAEYLLAHGFDKLVSANLSKSGLSALLTDLDKRHRAEAPEDMWPEFYAREVLAKYP